MKYSGHVTSDDQNKRSRPYRDLWLLGILLTLPVLIGLGMVWVENHRVPHGSLFELANLVGPTTQSLLEGRGLTACTEAMGTVGNPICFHAGRMPLATLVVSLGVRAVGNQFFRVDLLKTLLLLLPLEMAIYLVWLHFPFLPTKRRMSVCLLLLPFGMLPFLADVVNLQVEEGYIYSLLALAIAMLFFPARQKAESTLARAILFALTVDGVYLAKSSMIVVVAVLTLAYLILERRLACKMLVVVLIAAAPMGWALHQHHASGRYSVGTSIDGINLHKANNPDFLKLYPPGHGGTLDGHDDDLNRGIRFNDEWSFDDFHRQTAMTYLRSHPRETLQADGRKLWVIFVTLRKLGSGEDHGLVLKIETAGLLIFRLILWAALLTSIYQLFRGTRWLRELGGPSKRLIGLIFLSTVGAAMLPYLLGFAYTRHVSILIYPAVLLCCRMLQDDEG